MLCIGEALVALYPADSQPLETGRDLRVSTGGAEFNVAIHLARLGIATRFAGLVGDDPWGRKLTATLDDEGVDTSSVFTHPGRLTGCYLKESKAEVTSVYYYRARSAASSLEALPNTAFDQVGHVHLSGITPALSQECARLVANVLDMGQLRGHTTSFDINYRAGLWEPADAGELLLNLARRATTVFTGLDEAEVLWGCTTAAQVRSLFPDVGEVVVKDGPRAAVAYSKDLTESLMPMPADVVDIIGAGDAFAAGYLASRHRNGTLLEALAEGHRLAAEVIASTDDNGAPELAGAIGRDDARSPQ